MSTRSELLQLLGENRHRYMSGQAIGDSLNVSRNAIWKAIEQLRVDGYDIESRPRVGYRLHGGDNMLTVDAVKGHLTRDCRLEVFDSIASTNSYAMGQTLEERPLLIIANKQTSGRGRLGRTFFSPASTGIYLTIALKPNFDFDKALYVTMKAAVAVCKAIEEVADVRAKIKWVNDVYVNGKKVCGILTEAQTNFETGKINGLVIGIGINCFANGNMPSELDGIAGSISNKRNAFSRSKLAALVFQYVMDGIDTISDKAFLNEYRHRCMVLGKRIYIHPNLNDEAIKANAIDIDDNGGLVVEYMEGIHMREIATITTGEVSIRMVE